jgi:hypothetical protein
MINPQTGAAKLLSFPIPSLEKQRHQTDNLSFRILQSMIARTALENLRGRIQHDDGGKNPRERG